jgi:hypothetical protein
MDEATETKELTRHGEPREDDGSARAGQRRGLSQVASALVEVVPLDSPQALRPAVRAENVREGVLT